MTGLLLTASAAPAAEQPRLDRFAERPSAQAGVSSSVSSLTRLLTLPAGPKTLEFAYEVDSEPGDRLQVVVGGSLAWQLGGRLRRGRVQVPACPSAGPCSLRFLYRKDASGDGGLDTARIDDVVLRAASGELLAAFRFDEPTNRPPAGWGGSGPGGGWRVSMQTPPRAAGRPPAQAFLGNATPPTTSWMERQIHWPAAGLNFLDFDFFVDSEPNGDYLRVLVDGNLAWQTSGRNRAGTRRVQMGQGSHTIRFEYTKNGALDEGLDTARVRNVVARSGGETIELHDFAGQRLGLAPQVVGAATPDWQTGGHGGGFKVTDVLPPRSYVPLQTAGQKLATGFEVFVPPAVDGAIGDHRNATAIEVRNYGDSAAPAQLQLVADQAGPALHVALRVPGSTTAVGGEEGEVTLYLDGDRRASLEDRGCPQDRHAAGPEDRRLTFEFTIPGGASAAQIQGPVEEKGSCQGGFEPLGGRPSWPIQIAVSEPVDDAGSVHLEIALGPDPATGAFDDLRLGLGLVVTSDAAIVRFPFRDDGAGPVGGDVHSWETINFTYSRAEPEFSELLMDAACCYPRPSRPAIDW